MAHTLKSRDESLDAMAYAFVYSADSSTLDPAERRSFRDDVVSILSRVEEEIAQSQIEIQRNWFTRAREKIEEGLRFSISIVSAKHRALSARRKIFSVPASALI